MSADTTNDANSHAAVKATKLKASCDFCALSKIKCDRGQPQCQRCTKNGIMCHYSETRRIGKARQIYAASHTRPGSPTMQGTWPPKKPSTPQVQQKPKDYATGGTRRPSNSKDQIHGQDRHGSSDYVMPLALFDDFLSQRPQSITASLGYTKPARSENMVNSFMGPGSPGGFLANLGDTADLQTGDMNSMQDLDFDGERLWDVTVSGPSSTAGHTADCINRVSAVLQTLHGARVCVRSESSPAKPMLTLDMALQNNRMATDTVREVLDCPCSHGMSVALLLILTTHQVMESYRTVLIQHQAGPPAPRNQSATGNDYLLPIRDTPLAIGGYLLDDSMRTRVIVQVIRSELETIGALLDAFARYAEIMRDQPEEAVLGTYVEALRAGLLELSHTLDDQRIDV